MPDEKRSAILDAALRVFAKRGFAAARMSDIAIAAGVGKGTVYLYFESKEELLLGVLEFHVDQLLSMIDELGLSGVDLSEGIHAFFNSALTLAATNLDFLSIVEQRIFLLDPTLKLRGEAFFRSMIERLVDKVSSNMKSGTTVDYDLEIIAVVVIGSLASYRLYRVLHPEEHQATSLKKVSQELSRFFSAALLPPKL